MVNGFVNMTVLSGIVPENYTSIELTYVAAGNGAGEIETVVYKNGASTGATLTLAYDGSDRLSTITRS